VARHSGSSRKKRRGPSEQPKPIDYDAILHRLARPVELGGLGLGYEQSIEYLTFPQILHALDGPNTDKDAAKKKAQDDRQEAILDSIDSAMEKHGWDIHRAMLMPLPDFFNAAKPPCNIHYFRLRLSAYLRKIWDDQ
jgi:hypothetical protein